MWWVAEGISTEKCSLFWLFSLASHSGFHIASFHPHLKYKLPLNNCWKYTIYRKWTLRLWFCFPPGCAVLDGVTEFWGEAMNVGNTSVGVFWAGHTALFVLSFFCENTVCTRNETLQAILSLLFVTLWRIPLWFEVQMVCFLSAPPSVQPRWPLPTDPTSSSSHLQRKPEVPAGKRPLGKPDAVITTLLPRK